jgi:hypothetical protein
MPDAALLSAADADQLETADQIAAQASRMLLDAKARVAIGYFHALWLGIDTLASVTRDPVVFPTFSPSLLPLMQQETQLFVEHVIFDDDAKLATLMSAPYTFVSAPLASFYGLSGVSGTQPSMVQLGASPRGGLLTQGSVLTVSASYNQTSPVRRGKLIRNQFLCQELPPPPPSVMAQPPPIDPNATTRQKFQEHSTNPACAACHVLMDPIGFGFEGFDAIGRYRTTEHGLPVDTSGDLERTSDVNGPFNGVGDLSKRLAQSEDVGSCMVTQWFRYAQGRTETAEDACTLKALRTVFKASDRDLRQLLVALTKTDAFLYRKAVTP